MIPYNLALRTGVVACLCFLGSLALRYGDFAAISKIPFVTIVSFLFSALFLTDSLIRGSLIKQFEERERRLIKAVFFSAIGSVVILLLTFFHRIDSLPRTIPILFFVLNTLALYVLETPLIRLRQLVRVVRGYNQDVIVIRFDRGKSKELVFLEGDAVHINVGLMGEFKAPPVELLKTKVAQGRISRVVIDPDLCAVFPTEISELERFFFANLIRVHFHKGTESQSRLNKAQYEAQSQEKFFGREFGGKAVIITGAAGSIGSEICRMLASIRVKKMYLLDQNEYGLFKLSQELESFKGITFKLILGSIIDNQILDSINQDEQIYCLFHVAAYKHVPMLQEQPFRAFEVNTYGTMNIYRLAAMKQVARFVLVSSDKAVRPTNVMGATKRLSELAAYELSLHIENGPALAIVRFGNVYGSSGSVVETFMKQIFAREPLTLTDPEMRRYFMTISEAVSLTIAASTLDEDRIMFVLDMGDPLRVGDLASQIIDQLCPNNKEYPIRIIGRRPGEKVAEELFINPDDTAFSKNSAIILGNSELPESIELVEKIQDAISSRSLDRLFQIAEEHVESFDSKQALI